LTSYQIRLFEPSHPADCLFDTLSKTFSGNAYARAFRRELAKAVHSIRADLLIVDGIYHDVLGLQMEVSLKPHCRVARMYTHLPYKFMRGEYSGPGVTSIFLAPRDFELSQFIIKDSHYTEGTVFSDKDREFPWDLIANNRVIIYCSFGSQIEEYPEAED